jgi:hypothetical protein
LHAAILNRGKSVTMMREAALFGEFPPSLRFDDIEPEALAEEDAGPSLQPSPHGAALFLLAGRTAQGAERYAAALQASAATRGDLGQARYWHDVLTALGRIATGS